MVSQPICGSVLCLLFASGLPQQSAPPRDSPGAKPAAGAISGRITEQGSGRPMPRALVTLSPASLPTIDTEADAQGRYEFSGLAPGEYVLWATAGEHRATYLRQAYGDPAPMALLGGPPRSTIALGPGHVRADVDIALARALGIEGRVLNPYDEPMAEVRVLVLRANGRPAPAMPVYTDDRGEYRLFGLLPGRYRVCATPEGRDVSRCAMVTSPSGHARTRMDATRSPGCLPAHMADPLRPAAFVQPIWGSRSDRRGDSR